MTGTTTGSTTRGSTTRGRATVVAMGILGTAMAGCEVEVTTGEEAEEQMEEMQEDG
jgi:hypothetical protein